MATRLTKTRSATRRAPLTALARDNFIAIPLSSNVGEAVEKIRQCAPKGNIFYLYTTDVSGRLCGVVSLRNLIVAKDDEPIESIYSANVVFLSAELDVPAAYAIFSKAHFLSLPVVDEAGHILGVVNAHELLEEHEREIHHLFEERSRGDLFRLLGAQAEDTRRSALQVAAGRLPWLIVNLIGGTVSALIIHWLGGKVSHAVSILALVPVILAVSEGVGMQTASVVLTEPSTRLKARRFKTIYRELRVAVLMGLVCALLLGGGVFFFHGNSRLSLSISLALLLGAAWVCLLGGTLPRLFRRLNIDPHAAAGPVLLALADSSTLLLYLWIAQRLVR